MANAQPPPVAVQQQQNDVQNAEVNATNAETTVTPITMFLRYLHTGTTTSSIPVKSTAAIDLREIENTLACVMTMAAAQANLPVATIRKVRFCVCVVNSKKKHFLLTFSFFIIYST